MPPVTQTSYKDLKESVERLRKKADADKDEELKSISEKLEKTLASITPAQS